MNRETNFMNFENLNRLIEEHKKETHPYKEYEFDSTSYTLLLIDINNLVKENKVLKENAENNDKVVDKTNWENQLLKKENKQLKDNWNKLREYINIKLYNVEYLQKLCGCRIDDEIHMILDIIKKEMQELEQGDDK